MKLLFGFILCLSTFVFAENKDSLYVQFSGETVKIWNATELNCCSLYKIEAEIKDYQIRLTEIDTAKSWCKCLCDFNLCASLTGLAAGTYTVNVYRKNPLVLPADSLIYVGAITFNISGEKLPYLAASYQSKSYSYLYVKTYQSECLNETQDEQVIYSNSFESLQDTLGWNGYMDLRNEAAPGGGSRSVFISGGCIWPHAWFELPPLEENGYFILRCWGKDLQIGGQVGIRAGNDYLKEAAISINDGEWKYYESSDTLFCPNGQTIVLFMGAGGIIPSAILIDKVEIVKITTDKPTEVVDIKEDSRISSFGLFQNYPNPFNPETKIKYTISSSDDLKFVSLKIYDVLGNIIATLLDKEQSSGTYETNFDGRALSSGIYIYILSVDGRREQRKMCLIK